MQTPEQIKRQEENLEEMQRIWEQDRLNIFKPKPAKELGEKIAKDVCEKNKHILLR